VRFYHLSPRELLEELPSVVVASLITMMPAIHASERIARIEDVALGGGNLKSDVGDNLLRRLQRAATGPQKARPASAKDRAGMGIGGMSAPSAEPSDG
jgi:hypothetical protein